MIWPTNAELGGWILAGLTAVASAWKIRAFQSADKLTAKENDSKGGWISALERRAKEAEQEAHAILELHMDDIKKMALMQGEIDALKGRISQQDREIAMIKKLLFKARPDLQEMFLSSIPGRLPE